MGTLKDDKVYNFVFRGLLTEEALDNAGRVSRKLVDGDDPKIIEALSIHALDDHLVAEARQMSHVYTVIAAFENSVRELVTKTLLEKFGESWWTERVSSKIRQQAQERMTEEEKVRWHTQRGEDPINYTMLPNLLSIIRQNEEHFEDFIPSIPWAQGIFNGIDRSRNIIMHSGQLGSQDIARVGMYIRDWTAQVSI